MNDVKISAQILDIDEEEKTILVKEMLVEQNTIPCKLNISQDKIKLLKVGQKIIILGKIISEKFVESGNLNYLISIEVNDVEFLGFYLEDDFV